MNIRTYDDSVLIQESLGPVSLWALAGNAVVLLSFFRRRIGSVAFVLLALASGLAMAFGFAAVSIGELNMITSILGGILMGTGIDFGIFFIFRLREELLTHEDVGGAIRQTIINAGPRWCRHASTGATSGRPARLRPTTAQRRPRTSLTSATTSKQPQTS